MSIDARIEDFSKRRTGIRLIRIGSDSEDSLKLALSGILDTDNSSGFSSFLQNEIDGSDMKGIRSLVLDLSGISYISSTGIGSLVTLLGSCTKQDIELLLTRVPERVRGVMDLLGFSSYFQFQ
jgi:anti-anti-sigma factor